MPATIMLAGSVGWSGVEWSLKLKAGGLHDRGLWHQPCPACQFEWAYHIQSSAVAPSAHRHRHRHRTSPLVFPAPRSPSRCSPHSLTHFVQISLVSFFLKAWEKINTRWLALLSLPAAESMRWWGWRAMGIRFSNLHCPFACLLALSLTNLAYHGLTS